ncbi:hypothetical protein GDO78_009507 [Eleutherodactylus coqui]|uniref:Uncharacterized protein n=1 Tax=Eleutherodactylus coqui TaxID=57060 RepID=A0A8J6KCE4_ELECQ|nr:hypothetical protein GDO78_009507 [Eleutherodactylus coqui]
MQCALAFLTFYTTRISPIVLDDVTLYPVNNRRKRSISVTNLQYWPLFLGASLWGHLSAAMFL